MLSLKIAYRYLRSPKSHGAVNVITRVSIAGVAVSTMAMIVVLSIFNGFSDLSASHLAILDPDIHVSRQDNRVISDGDSLAAVLSEVPGVSAALPTLSGRALMTTPTTQTPIQFRGVPEGYERYAGIDSAIIQGRYATHTTSGMPVAVISVGVANNLKQGLAVTDPDALHLYVPRRVGRINPANPSAAFIGTTVAVSGIFSVSQPEYDTDYILLPLETARELLDYYTEASDIAIYLDDDADPEEVARAIDTRLGNDSRYVVKNALEIHAEAFKMIKIEKWVTFMMLIFILVIALFNIVSTLSLLVIEKRDNMKTLRDMGSPRSLVRRVFIIEGWLITSIGGVIGIIAGIGLSLLQQWGHILKLSADAESLTIDYYPVRVAPWDVLVVMATVAVTGLIASQATRLFTRRLN